MSAACISAASGLCNRLRKLFAWYELSQAAGRELRVYWQPDRDCPGFFLDYFQPLPGVEVIKSLPPRNVRLHDIPTDDPCGARQKKSRYASLWLNARMEELLTSVRRNEPYNSAHVRRTDHINLALRNGFYTPNHEYERYILHSELPVYLATDTEFIQRRFVRIFGNKVLRYAPITYSRDFRQTNLEHAIIDLYMCIAAADFMPSGYSSFSDFIMTMREAP